MTRKKVIAILCALVMICSILPGNASAKGKNEIHGYRYTIYEGDTTWSFIKRLSGSDGATVYIGSSSKALPLFSDKQLKKKSSVSIKKGKTILVTLNDVYGTKKNSNCGAKIKYNKKTYYIPYYYLVSDVDFSVYDYQLVKPIPYYSIIREKKGTLQFNSKDITSYENAYPILGIHGRNIVIYNTHKDQIVSVDSSDFYTKPVDVTWKVSLYDDYTCKNSNYKMLCIKNYSDSSNVDAQLKIESKKTIDKYKTRYQFTTQYYPEEGMYKIVNVKSQKCLEVRDGKLGKSSSIRQYKYRSEKDDCQMFQIIKAPGSYVYVRSKLGTYMYFGSSYSGTDVGVIQRYNLNSDSLLKWHLVRWN